MIHFHRWGRWQDVAVQMGAGPLGKKLGLPDVWVEPRQARQCSRCGKTKLRSLS